MRLTLPIDSLLPQVQAHLRERPNLVLRAATGAGKTTRVPPALLQGPAGDGQVVMLEPRRVAARAAARRMSKELGSPLGSLVGYQVRFDRKASAATRILVVTEGILVQMLQRDPFLEGISCLVFDEFHERNLYSDLSLAMARKVQEEARPDLKLIVMSATLDAEPLVRWLGGTERCSRLDSEGRLFPVETSYWPRQDARGLPILVREGVADMLGRTPGDILVFLPGVGEIKRCRELLEPVAAEKGVELHALYGDLPPEAQDAVLRPSPTRRVILSTNVAETSVTIDGVTAVIDSGLARVLRFDPAHGLDRLELSRISRASAEQRKGRAGRLQEGHCLRLWTEFDDRSLQAQEEPEIRRVDLCATALELLVWGETDLTAFPFFETPPEAAWERALDLLVRLDACTIGPDGRAEVTAAGRDLARLPVHPRLGRLLVEGRRLGVLWGASVLAALVSERDVVFRPSTHRPVVAMATAPSDLLDRMDAVLQAESRGYGETALGPVDKGRARNVVRVARRLADLAERRLNDAPEIESDPNGAEEALLRSVLAAYPDRVARRREPGGRRALMVGGKGVKLAEMSAVHDAELFVCVELEGAKGRRGEALVRQASAIRKEWLEPLETAVEARFDVERRRVVGLKTTRFQDLILSQAETDPGPEKAAEVLAAKALEDLDTALALEDPEVAGFLARVRCLREWMPSLDLPAFDADRWAEILPHLASGRRSFDELRKAPLLAVLKGTLSYPQATALEREAPERLTVPSGSAVRLTYEPGKPPVLAVRIQELFGLTETPRVADGRVPVLLHLLAPNMRPQQITQDLKSFWSVTYPQVKKDLAGRYPKHAWPDDPMTAEPMRGAKRRKRD